MFQTIFLLTFPRSPRRKRVIPSDCIGSWQRVKNTFWQETYQLMYVLGKVGATYASVLKVGPDQTAERLVDTASGLAVVVGLTAYLHTLSHDIFLVFEGHLDDIDPDHKGPAVAGLEGTVGADLDYTTDPPTFLRSHIRSQVLHSPHPKRHKIDPLEGDDRGYFLIVEAASAVHFGSFVEEHTADFVGYTAVAMEDREDTGRLEAFGIDIDMAEQRAAAVAERHRPLSLAILLSHVL